MLLFPLGKLGWRARAGEVHCDPRFADLEFRAVTLSRKG